ncbi:recombinase family protein [Flavobacterium cupreum]|uniref:Recombinase family protein n=1 Tax=Flavobacterium cupreum TaxID=2133766 RepID=A0A434A2L3_9FLAO|nr:recombinase family protein [Flavobacterium cupreum]RUT68576.1 recombinase family protein [Flavobacterium cupreum]
MKIGYARVSTGDQNISSQIHLLEQAGCERIFQDQATGVNDKRPGLQEMLGMLRKDDIVIVYKIDRIFRSFKEMIKLVEFFNNNGVFFSSISQSHFDTSSANGRFILNMFAIFAEFERDLISDRTKEGLANARRRNQTLGRPKGIKPAKKIKYETALHFYKNKNIPIDTACENAGISKTTFYRVDAFYRVLESEKKTADPALKNQVNLLDQIEEIGKKKKIL